MAETYTPKSPRPTRAQIDKVFGSDPDFARKVDKLFEDLVNAAAAANANAREIDEVHEHVETIGALVARSMALSRYAQALAEANELLSGAVYQLRARLTRLERAVSDLQEAPL